MTNLNRTASSIAAATMPADAVEMIDIGGRCLAFSDGGAGAPAVVLETGLGAESREWTAVQRGVEDNTRVCRYDRAGRGSSEPAPGPRTAFDLVADLNRLLRIANVRPPCILVGHSFGGLLMRLYAHRHRTDVAGLVLVDSMHEDQFDVFGPLFPPPRASEPAALRDTRAFWTSGWRDSQSTVERIDFASSIEQARSVVSLGDLPLHIITAGTFLNQPVLPILQRAALQERWDALQRSFLRLSSCATQSFAPASGHFVQRDEPGIVVNAIRKMLARVTQTSVIESSR